MSCMKNAPFPDFTFLSFQFHRSGIHVFMALVHVNCGVDGVMPRSAALERVSELSVRACFKINANELALNRI